MQHLWMTALPRLMAAAWITAMVSALAIRAAFCPGRSHLSLQPRSQGRHRRLR